MVGPKIDHAFSEGKEAIGGSQEGRLLQLHQYGGVRKIPEVVRGEVDDIETAKAQGKSGCFAAIVLGSAELLRQPSLRAERRDALGVSGYRPESDAILKTSQRDGGCIL
jgi:hypothetical protein